MLPRFYVPDLSPQDGIARLPSDEAHHLVKVLRLAPGALVQVFDGRGVEWRGRVETARRDRTEVSLLEPIASPQPAVSLTLVQAVLKGQAMDDVVRDCAMLGVAGIQPLVSRHTTVKAATLANAAERWRRIALASAKQCGTAVLPVIREVVSFDEWIVPSVIQPAFILVEPAVAEEPLTVRQLASQPVPPKASLMVGPEGGWSEDERDRAVIAEYRPLSLGRMTLRAAAVPLAAAAALLAIWDLPPEGGSHESQND